MDGSMKFIGRNFRRTLKDSQSVEIGLTNKATEGTREIDKFQRKDILVNPCSHLPTETKYLNLKSKHHPSEHLQFTTMRMRFGHKQWWVGQN